jgi:hypothetical protein
MFNSNLCVVCEDSISDPVCRSCYLKQIGVLLNDLHLHEITVEIILKKIKSNFPTSNLNDTKCILCRRENVTLCRYCFSIILKNILRELNFTEDLIKNFGYDPMYEEISLEEEKSDMKIQQPLEYLSPIR